MKNLILASLICVLSSAISAQAFAANETVTIKLPKSDTEIPRVPMFRSDFMPFVATYRLSNGQDLRITARGEAKFAAINGGELHQIVATSSKSFISTDRQLEMTIVLGEDGEASGELSVYAPQSVASAGHGALLMHLALH